MPQEKKEPEEILFHISWNVDEPSEDVVEAITKMVKLAYESDLTNSTK